MEDEPPDPWRGLPRTRVCPRCGRDIWMLRIDHPDFGRQVVRAVDPHDHPVGYLVLTSAHTARFVRDEECDQPWPLFVLHGDLTPCDPDVT